MVVSEWILEERTGLAFSVGKSMRGRLFGCGEYINTSRRRFENYTIQARFWSNVWYRSSLFPWPGLTGKYRIYFDLHLLCLKNDSLARGSILSTT